MTDPGNMPQRILYTNRPTGGGSTLSLLELVRGLDTKRYQPVVLFFAENIYQKQFEELGLRVITLNGGGWHDVRVSGNAGGTKRRMATKGLAAHLRLLLHDLGTARRVAGIIKDEKIHLVHQNTGFDRAVMIAAMMTGIPQVAHFRNFKMRIGVTNKILSARVDSVIHITQAIANHYKALGINDKRASVIYDAIDVERFSVSSASNRIREEFSIPPDGSLIINVGRITPWKGQDCFLRAVLEVIKAFPQTKVLIVGNSRSNDGDQRFEESLKSFVEQHQLSEAVCFTGLRSDVAELMAASDIVVHSATRPEPWGRVIPEAMVAGTPVIATAGGGVPELIENGRTGLLVPLGDSASMARAIKALFEDKAKAKIMADEARQEAVRLYTIERHARSIEKIYAELLGPGAGERR